MIKVSRVAGVLPAVVVFALHAADTNITLTVNGLTYSNVTFGSVTAASVTISHKSGIARVPLAELPPSLQKQFGYDPMKAQAEIGRQREAQRQDQQAAERLASGRRARLLGTKLDFINRYGDPIGYGTYPDPFDSEFKQGDLIIRVRFGKSGEIIGQESVENKATNLEVCIVDGQFSDQAMLDILSANGGGSSWDVGNLPEPGYYHGVKTRDGKRCGTLNRFRITLSLLGITKRVKDATRY